MNKNYMAINQWGEIYNGLTNPRKDLLIRLCETKAKKIYQNKKDGSTVHIGYIINGQWLTLYEVKPFEVIV